MVTSYIALYSYLTPAFFLVFSGNFVTEESQLLLIDTAINSKIVFMKSKLLLLPLTYLELLKRHHF